MAFADDSPSDTPYRPYDPDTDSSATQIYVDSGAGKPTELSSASETVKQLTSRRLLRRYYIIPELADDARSIARACQG